MNANFVFVHGTGVRQPAYSETLEKIEKHLKEKDKSFRVHECYWGGECGSRLNEGGKSIPTFDTTRSIDGSLSEEDYKIGLWNLLYQDPLFELEILSLRESDIEEYVPRQELPGEALDQTIRSFTPSPLLLERLAETGIKPEIFEQARSQIVAEDNYRNALNQAQPPMGDYRLAIAKALVAQSAILVSEEYGAQALCLTGDLRDQIVTQIVSEIGGSERGPVDWVKNLLQEKLPKLLDSATVATTNSILQIPTSMALRKRGSLSEDHAATAGDVIMYQARGQGIRDFICRKIQDIKNQEPASPVILLAHSLGGIATVDLLLEPNPPQVDLLVTIGSQAPLLYEWNALVNMEYKREANLPDTFPKWLNIYDERDFLSYIGAGMFPDKVEDIKVSNGQPLNASHGAYWNNSKVWEAIFERIPK